MTLRLENHYPAFSGRKRNGGPAFRAPWDMRRGNEDLAEWEMIPRLVTNARSAEPAPQLRDRASQPVVPPHVRGAGATAGPEVDPARPEVDLSKMVGAEVSP